MKQVDYQFRHTNHSILRVAQRSIRTDKIATTLQYGDNIYKQGLIFYIPGEDNIPASLSK